jgi:hypothetical protein
LDFSPIGRVRVGIGICETYLLRSLTLISRWQAAQPSPAFGLPPRLPPNHQVVPGTGRQDFEIVASSFSSFCVRLQLLGPDVRARSALGNRCSILLSYGVTPQKQILRTGGGRNGRLPMLGQHPAQSGISMALDAGPGCFFRAAGL